MLMENLPPCSGRRQVPSHLAHGRERTGIRLGFAARDRVVAAPKIASQSGK
jgi:hypothetical protein